MLNGWPGGKVASCWILIHIMFSLSRRNLVRLQSLEISFFYSWFRTGLYMQELKDCVRVRVRVRVCVCWQANKSFLIVQDTLVTMLKSIPVLKHADVFLPDSLLTFSLVWVSYDHSHMNTTIHRRPYAHKHTSVSWSKPQMALNRLLWAGLDESVSLETGFFCPLAGCWFISPHTTAFMCHLYHSALTRTRYKQESKSNVHELFRFTQKQVHSLMQSLRI